METILKTHSNDDTCNQDEAFLVRFTLTSEELNDAENKSEESNDEENPSIFSDVLVVITWCGNVVKLTNENEVSGEFNGTNDLLIHATPNHLSTMLKTSPIMFDLSRECTELGTIKLEISSCFADAVLCTDFNSQSLMTDLKFFTDGVENANMTACLEIQKLSSNGILGNLFKEMNSNGSEQAIKSDKLKVKGGNDEGLENEPCDDLPENCFRRIINKTLLDLKDQIDRCDEVRPVADENIKQLCKTAPEQIPLSSRFQFDCTARCVELFNDFPCDCQQRSRVRCPTCNGCPASGAGSLLTTKVTSAALKQHCKGNLIDRNIHEEDLLKKLCDKYGINVDDVRAVGRTEKVKCKRARKKKIKKVKNVKNSVKCKDNPCDG